jgi:hypothetical protein
MILVIIIVLWPLINRFVMRPLLGRELGEIPKGEII